MEKAIWTALLRTAYEHVLQRGKINGRLHLPAAEVGAYLKPRRKDAAKPGSRDAGARRDVHVFAVENAKLEKVFAAADQDPPHLRTAARLDLARDLHADVG